MNKLVLHHTYNYGSMFDISGFRNHGEPSSIGQVISPGLEGTVVFYAPESAIRVRPSQSLQSLIAIDTRVRFLLEPSAMPRRHNLIEAHGSFALFIEPDGTLTGNVLDATGNWSGVSSGSNLITAGTWHTAQLVHDGINRVQIGLDGSLVKESFESPGPVRPVGPNGVAIGAWPDGPSYAFSGFIDDVALYKYDPPTEAAALLRRCSCIDAQALDRVTLDLLASGFTPATLDDMAAELLKIASQITALLRTTDPKTAHQQIAASQITAGALLRRDSRALTQAHDYFEAQANASPQRDAIAQLQQQFAAITAKYGLSDETWKMLANAICMAIPNVAVKNDKEKNRGN